MDGCIFCEIVRGEAPSWRVYEDEASYAFLNIFPATEWHTLVVPKAHHVDVFDTPAEDFVAVAGAVKKVVDRYQRTLGISDVQIINSSGPGPAGRLSCPLSRRPAPARRRPRRQVVDAPRVA